MRLVTKKFECGLSKLEEHRLAHIRWLLDAQEHASFESIYRRWAEDLEHLEQLKHDIEEAIRLADERR